MQKSKNHLSYLAFDTLNHIEELEDMHSKRKNNQALVR